jgi:hypothetical protein
VLRLRTLGRATLAALLAASVVSGLSSSAEALPTCDFAQFPAVQASQSALRFSCLFANGGTALTNEAPTGFTFHDYQNVEYHQGAARKVKVTTAALAGVGAINASAGHFLVSEVNRPVSGTGIPERAFIKSVTAGTLTLNIAHLAVPLNTVLTIENSDARTVDNIVTVAGTNTVTSATANFKTSDIGKSIKASTLAEGSTITAVATPTGGVSATVSLNALASTGTGYPAGCTSAPPLPTCNPPVATIGQTQTQSTTRSVADATNSATTITSAAAAWGPSDLGLKVSGAGIPATAYVASYVGTTATIAGGPMTASAAARNVVIGEPGATAPADGSGVVQWQTAMDLNPAQAGGSGNCGSSIPEGFAQQGVWRNPGSYLTASVLGAQPAAGQSIAQILFMSSVLSVAAYIQKMPAGVVGDPQPLAHYDIVFPFVTTTFAMCPPPNAVKMALSVHVLAASSSQALVAAGIGRPYSAQVRYLTSNSVGVKTATVKSASTTAPKNWSVAKSCTIPAAIAALAFSCGFD